MRTLHVGGLDLEVDDGGRVDITAVNRRFPAIRRSPSEWARTRRCRDLMRDLMSDPRTPLHNIWRIDGATKQARTWAHPTLAAAYLEDLEGGGRTPDALTEAFDGLCRGVVDLEGHVAALRDGVEALKIAVADVERRVTDIETQILGWGEGLE